MHCLGIEPRAIAWKANMLPLHQQCKMIIKIKTKKNKKTKKIKAHGGIRTHNFQIRSLTRYPIASRRLTPCTGIEPVALRLTAARSNQLS